MYLAFTIARQGILFFSAADRTGGNHLSVSARKEWRLPGRSKCHQITIITISTTERGVCKRQVKMSSILSHTSSSLDRPGARARRLRAAAAGMRPLEAVGRQTRPGRQVGREVDRLAAWASVKVDDRTRTNTTSTAGRRPPAQFARVNAEFRCRHFMYTHADGRFFRLADFLPAARSNCGC